MILRIKDPYSYILQKIFCNMPSGIVTKLYNKLLLFFATKIVSREFKSSINQGNYFT